MGNMKNYLEINDGLFDKTCPHNQQVYALVCGADFVPMGGLANEVEKRFGTFSVARNCKCKPLVGECVIIENVALLVIKKRYNAHADADALQEAFVSLIDHCMQCGIYHIDMPAIGSGGNGIPWEQTRNMICEYLDKNSVFVHVHIPQGNTRR